MPLGDRYDRMHTGGVFISFHGDNKWPVNLVELGYNKFTGYSKNLYELSNKVGNGYLYHKDEGEQYYNKSRWTLNISNVSQGYGLSLNLYNIPSLDIQHKIHLSHFYSLHMVPYKWHFSISGFISSQSTLIGLQ